MMSNHLDTVAVLAMGILAMGSPGLTQPRDAAARDAAAETAARQGLETFIRASCETRDRPSFSLPEAAGRGTVSGPDAAFAGWQ